MGSAPAQTHQARPRRTAEARRAAAAGASSASSRRSSSREGPAGRRRFSSASSLKSSSSMAVGCSQFAAQGGERITIARSRGVGRKVELLRDLIEREVAPDLEPEHLALFIGQFPERSLDRFAPIGAFPRSLEDRRRGLAPPVGPSLAGRAPRFAPAQIDRRAPHRRDQERHRFTRQRSLVPPKPHEGFLHNVLGICR